MAAAGVVHGGRRNVVGDRREELASGFANGDAQVVFVVVVVVVVLLHDCRPTKSFLSLPQSASRNQDGTTSPRTHSFVSMV